MSKPVVGVLRGGASNKYDESLKTGGLVLKRLSERYAGKDIYISKDGQWHIDGWPRTPEQILNSIDVAFNALHGKYGEDGKVQKILDSYSKPYTGSESFSSAVGMNKVLSKKAFEAHGIKTPHCIIVKRGQDFSKLLRDMFTGFVLPAIVKPASMGNSVGVTLVHYYHDIPAALEYAFEYGDTAIIEEFIKGREASCGVIDDFRGEHAYALLPVELVRPEGKHFLDQEVKSKGLARHEFGRRFADEEKWAIQATAKAAHAALRLRHYSNSDFVVHPKRGVYLLEVNTLPELVDDSTFNRSLDAVGCSFPDFLDHLLQLALNGK